MRNNNTISRHVNFPNAQFVFFSLGNNNGNVQAYGGQITPFVTPPPTVTPTSAVTSTPTAAANLHPGARPTVAHDAQYYDQTGFRVDDQTVSYFKSRGGVDTFGYPSLAHVHVPRLPGADVPAADHSALSGHAAALINLLDPEIFPYTRVNGSVFPSPDDQLKQQTPAVGTSELRPDIMPFIQSVRARHVHGPTRQLLADVPGRAAASRCSARRSRTRSPIRATPTSSISASSG